MSHNSAFTNWVEGGLTEIGNSRTKGRFKAKIIRFIRQIALEMPMGHLFGYKKQAIGLVGLKF